MPLDPSEIDLFDPANGLPDWLSGGSASDTAAPLLAGLTDLDLGAALGIETEDGEPTPDARAVAVPPCEPQADGWAFTVGEVAHAPDDGPELRTYRFQVRNASDSTEYECVAEFPLAPAYRGVLASHKPARTASGLRWEFGALKPGALAAVEVRVPLTAASRALAQSPVPVRIGTRPLLAQIVAHIEAPTEVPANAPVAAVAIFTNVGRGASGPGRVVASCGSLAAAGTLPALAPGAACRVPLELPPGRIGTATWELTASAGGAILARASASVRTRAAELRAALSVPARVELDEEIEVRVRVENASPVPATGAHVTLAVPDELIFRGTDCGGALSATGERVEWDAGALAPGSAWVATVRFAGFAPGKPRLVARVSCDTAPDTGTDARLLCELRRTGGNTLAELLAGLKVPAPAQTGATAEPRRDTGARCLVVRYGRARFALPLPNVRDALRPLPLTPLPGAPEWVAGVCNVRGDIVTAVDLAAFFELGDGAQPRGLVIATAGELVFGLLVDEIVGIRAPAESGAELPDGPLTRFLTGVATDENGLLHRLSVGELLAALESELCAPARA
jgi:purine-binding chemotaxis protein CheW